VLAQLEPIVGGEHHDRVVEAAGVIQRLEGRTDQVVDRTERLELVLSIGVDRRLIFRGDRR
jgi:hypothetical protein